MKEVGSTTIERILAGAALIFGGFGVFVVAYFNPAASAFFPICPFHALTGYSCPGCGLTRGFHSLFHGDILSALTYNVMLPVYLVIFLYIGVSFLLIVFRGRGFNVAKFSPKLVYAFFIASFVFVVLRNIPLYPFTLFSN